MPRFILPPPTIPSCLLFLSSSSSLLLFLSWFMVDPCGHGCVGLWLWVIRPQPSSFFLSHLFLFFSSLYATSPCLSSLYPSFHFICMHGCVHVRSAPFATCVCDHVCEWDKRVMVPSSTSIFHSLPSLYQSLFCIWTSPKGASTMSSPISTLWQKIE